MSNKDIDEDEDVSRIFARHTNRAFQRDFAEFLPARQKSAESKTRISELNVKLIEAREKINQLQRSLDGKNIEVEQLQAADADAQAKAGRLRDEIDQLKSELSKLRRRSENTEQAKISERMLMEDFRTALGKFRTWYTYAERQMEVMKNILQDADKWNESNRYKIYFSYKDLQPLTVNDSDLPSLCEVPVCAYPGIEEIEGITNSESSSNIHNISTQTDQLESGFIQLEEDFSSRPSSQACPASQQLNKSFCEDSSAAAVDDQWRYLELVERLQKLESENAKLRDEVIILKQRDRDNVLLAERKSDVEAELQILKEQNLSVIVEHERLKDAIRSKLFQELERHNANEIIQKISETCSRNAELEQKLSDAMADKDAPLSAEKVKRMAHFFSQKYQAEIDELQRKLAKFQQPSDTTCVYRFQANNPLDEAYEEFLVNQAASSSANSSKRRKLDSSVGSEGEASSEELRELRRKVEQSERSLKLQKECALEYRQVVTALTGYQVKMREEGLCEVQSVFGQGGTFCFKRRADCMDLLDNECAQQWKRHVSGYLVKYNSVPAFLASIVLALVEGDASMLSTSLLDYTRDTQQVL